MAGIVSLDEQMTIALVSEINNNMQSRASRYDEKEYRDELEKMKGGVKELIEANQDDPLVELELIDVIQQLGLDYHFEAEIQHALDLIHKRPEDSSSSHDLCATALRFRLLRQHGHYVSQDVFKIFMNENDNFRESLQEDVEGLLSLYQASFLGVKGETIIDKAVEFSYACLKNIEKNNLSRRLAMKIDHALDMPMHWRPNRFVARWFIGVYEKEPDMNPTLLKLAKLDFNIVQSFYKKEIDELTRWWVELGITKIGFSSFRDFTLESYMHSILMRFEPRYEAFRVMNAKIGCLITVMDDVYDTYGSWEEIELLTDFVSRWDITGIDRLPCTIQTVFLAMYNTTNEIGCWAMMERGINIIPYLRKALADQCKAYLVEAKYKGLNPLTLEEYLNTAAATAGGHIMQQWCFMATAETLTAETLDFVSKIPRIVFSSTLILRLVNDLATSLFGRDERDNMKAVECYMNETGVSEEAARDHIKYLIRETWKTMNEETFDHHPLSRSFVNACLDHARSSHYFYQYGNGHDNFRGKTRDDVISLFIQPIPLD